MKRCSRRGIRGGQIQRGEGNNYGSTLNQLSGAPTFSRAYSYLRRRTGHFGGSLISLFTALLVQGPEAAGSPPPGALEVTGIHVTSAGSWTTLPGTGRRLTLRYNSSDDPEITVRVVLQGSACTQPFATWRLGLLVDGLESADACSLCDCMFSRVVSPGAHTLTARVLDNQQLLVAHRQVLVRLVRDGPRPDGADFTPNEAPRAAALLRDYAALHRRIVDPDDTSVAKRFLVVRSSHGLSNTQIEEVTGLLMAMVTGRALILDFSNDTYTGQRPVMEYAWPLDLWMESMSMFIPEGADMVSFPPSVYLTQPACMHEYVCYTLAHVRTRKHTLLRVYTRTNSAQLTRIRTYANTHTHCKTRNTQHTTHAATCTHCTTHYTTHYTRAGGHAANRKRGVWEVW